MRPDFYGKPIGLPQVEVAPVFPLAAVPSTGGQFSKAPTWPPPALDDSHEAMRQSSEISHRAVSTLLDRGRDPAAPMLLKDAFSTLFSKLDRPSDNANLDLVAELVDLRQRIVARLEGQRNESLSAAQAAHATIFAACRQAKDARDKLATELNAATSYAQAIAFEPLAAAKTAVANMEGARPARESFPTPEELSAWWQNVEQERSKLAAVQARYNAQLGVVARLQRELAAAQVEFDKLTAKEQELAAKAENRPGRMLGVEVAAPLSEI
jgi:hypothetical protein